MRLEPLCTLALEYDERGGVPDGGFVLVAPYAGGDGSGYGAGHGTVRGERLNGVAAWSNHPRRRSDGRMLPDAHGVILTDDGARVIFGLCGRTVFRDPDRGEQSLMGWFESDDERYLWLNDVVCVAEGEIRMDTARADIDVYVAVNELGD
jgi:hypothetical protein